MLLQNHANNINKIDEVVNQAYEVLKQRSNEKSIDTINRYYRSQKYRVIESLKVVLSLANSNDKNPILEIGSFPYLVTLSLAQFGFEVVGIDLQPDQSLCTPTISNQDQNNQFHFEVKKCNIETDVLPFEDNQFDTIIFWETFEHLRIDLIFTCQEIYRVLKPGGILLLSTPNFLRYNKLMSLLRKGESGDIFKAYNALRYQKNGQAGHIREYTPKDVINFMNEIGFNHKKTVYIGEAKIGIKLGELLQFFACKAIPASRNFFMLVLAK